MKHINWNEIWYELERWEDIHVHASDEEKRLQLEKTVERHRRSRGKKKS